jgi:hypothetical protein
LHRGPPDLAGWIREPPSQPFDVEALELVAARPRQESPSYAASDLALFAANVLRGLVPSAPANARRALEEEIARLGAALQPGKRDPIFVWERWNAAQKLLAELDRDGGVPPPSRLVGWPEVSPSEGTWQSEMFFIAIRAGHVNRVLRLLGGRFEPCFSTAGGAPVAGVPRAVALRFVIGRDGTVSTAQAPGEPASDTTRCLTRAAYGLTFPQPDGGTWEVDARFHVR